ncbi:uncharacterized protein LOC135477171 [Liolophura sinensis]|uniref:uncharacterized protein LOC135477171 n=1 Tax=Liolophura sinensis TaxID=3198878 RepID=UPI003157F25B
MVDFTESFTEPVTNPTQPLTNFTQSVTKFTQSIPNVTQPIPKFTKSMTNFTKRMTTFSQSLTNVTQRITNLAQRVPNFTIVTAFFNLGSFRKGFWTTFTPELYQGWASVFGRMQNNLVVYTDDLTFKQIIEDSRLELKAQTSVVFIQNRSSLWAFQLRPHIQTIFADPSYPKHHPNTVLADYPCAQHAKYEVVARTIQDRVFPAAHYAWLDVGYFRDIVDQKFSFSLQVPGDFDDNKIAYTKIAEASLSVEPATLIKQNSLWIGGGMFIGTPKTLLTYFEQYKRAVHFFLSEQLMNSDQQMVYGMFTDKGRQIIKPTIELQLYTPQGPGNPWFYLGFHCLRKLNDPTV